MCVCFSISPDFLVKLGKQLNVPVIHLVCGVLAVLLAALVFFFGQSAMDNFIGVLFPTYMTFKALTYSSQDVRGHNAWA